MGDDPKLVTYRQARLACELARSILESHDFKELIADIDRANAIGPLVDPSLYIRKGRAMAEDRDIFVAARTFLKTWPEPPENG